METIRSRAARIVCAAVLLAGAPGLAGSILFASPAADSPIRFGAETQYLVFEVPIDAVLDSPEPEVFGRIDAAVADLVRRVGTTGDGRVRQLGFVIGIPAWIADRLYPQRIPVFIREAFRVAAKRGVAVHLTIESHYLWQSRPDLWNYFDPSGPGYDPNNRENVEWSDWNGTPYPARFLDWGTPQVLPPHMCYACPRIRSEVLRISRDVIGAPLKAGLDALAAEGKESLFSGVTVTSEPSIDNYSVVDFADPPLARFMDSLGAAKLRVGYNSLTRAGYGRSNQPSDMTAALGEINRQFASLWAEGLASAGIPPSKLYTHVAAPAGVPGWPAYSYMNAPLSAAFADSARPGFTTYPGGPLASGLEPIYEELARHGNPPWAGTEASPFGFGTPIEPYEYLRWHFDHGAVLVLMNTAASDATLADLLDRAVWGPEALAAYTRFLTAAGPRPPSPPTRTWPRARVSSLDEAR